MKKTYIKYILFVMLFGTASSVGWCDKLGINEKLICIVTIIVGIILSYFLLRKKE